MDKMGESELAGNKGIPATPRDGANIEIVGMLKSTLRWLINLNQNYPDIFPYSGVDVHNEKDSFHFSYSEWNNLIQENFENYFFVHEGECEFTNEKYVHKRFIYKDTVGGTNEWADYQLRPNQCVAMVTAPELFTASNEKLALEKIQEKLLGRLGIKTLDPDDWNYHPYYINQDNNSYQTAKGFNYHNGPV